MASMEDDRLADSHLGIALLVGTLVASPVLLAALSGRQAVPTALALYVAAIIGSWMVVGLVGGAFAMVARVESSDDVDTHGGDGHGSTEARTASATREPDPAVPSR
ncbi:MAG: hypothetical protein JJE52_18950 [Acidimicrobiia bacterium]|nr:hypothetical protein [Acidimicrobiia bacterium]